MLTQHGRIVLHIYTFGRWIICFNLSAGGFHTLGSSPSSYGALHTRRRRRQENEDYSTPIGTDQGLALHSINERVTVSVTFSNSYLRDSYWLLFTPVSKNSVDGDMLFQWTALGAGQYRLLKKRRPLSDGQLSYELQTATIGVAPAYAVVSYTRTAGPKDQAVLVNGRSLTVSKSAHAALKEVADHGEYDLIWIDCLSIHETDAEEKTTQGKVLEKIYAAAECVYICRNPDSQEAPDLPTVDAKTRVLMLRSSL